MYLYVRICKYYIFTYRSIIVCIAELANKALVEGRCCARKSRDRSIVLRRNRLRVRLSAACMCCGCVVLRFGVMLLIFEWKNFWSRNDYDEICTRQVSLVYFLLGDMAWNNVEQLQVLVYANEMEVTLFWRLGCDASFRDYAAHRSSLP